MDKVIKGLLKIYDNSVKKSVAGVVSIFLCIILTPVLTFASVMIEYYRHQTTAQTTKELVDCSTLSTLANYDEYLQERFGLFAISQDCDIQKEYTDNFNKNKNILGKALGSNSEITAKGTNPLSDVETLKAQILDFSESTVLTETLLDDLRIQDLVERLGSLSGFEKITSAADTAAALTSAVKEMVTSGEKLVESIKTAKESISDLVSKANALATSVSELYKAVKTDSEKFDVEKSDSLVKIAESYKSKIDAAYYDAKQLKAQFNTVKDSIEEIPRNITALESAVGKAKIALDNSKTASKNVSETVKNENPDNDNINKAAANTNGVLEVVIDELEKTLSTAKEKLTNTVVNEVKASAEQAFDDIKDELFNLPAYSKDYFKIENGKFKNAQAEQDLKKLLSLLPKTWEEGSNDALLKQLKNMFVPEKLKINNLLESTRESIADIIERAKQKCIYKIESGTAKILSSLVNALRGLFDLELFYDGDLSAFVNSAYTVNGAQSEYQGFLDALTKLLNAVDTFTSSKSGFFKKLGAVGDMFSAISKAVKTTVEVAKSTLHQMQTLMSYVTNPNRAYTTLLLAGYMAHNLPNRTNAADFVINSDLKGCKTELSGEALTGFGYSDIKVPLKKPEACISGIGGLSDFLKKAAKGGTDAMFMGAELEYILAGTTSEIFNQTIVFMQLYFMRLILDLPSVLCDKAVAGMASAASIAAWAVYLIVAIAEPFCDTVFLVNGSTAPLIKTSCYLTPVGVPQLITKLGDVSMKNATVKDKVTETLNKKVEEKLKGYKDKCGKFEKSYFEMDYQTHAIILMMMSCSDNDIVKRFSNIVQLETNYQQSDDPSDKKFEIKKAYTAIETETDVKFGQFISIFDFGDDGLGATFKHTKGY